MQSSYTQLTTQQWKIIEKNTVNSFFHNSKIYIDLKIFIKLPE